MSLPCILNFDGSILSGLMVSVKVRRTRPTFKSRLNTSKYGIVSSVIKLDAIIALPLVTASMSLPNTSSIVDALIVIKVLD